VEEETKIGLSLVVFFCTGLASLPNKSHWVFELGFLSTCPIVWVYQPWIVVCQLQYNSILQQVKPSLKAKYCPHASCRQNA